MTFPTVVLFGGRIFGTLQILMGLALWTGMMPVLLPIHIVNGLLVTLVLIAAAWIGRRAGSSIGMTVFAVAWALMLPVFGLAHAALMPGPFHWVVQVIHLIVGIVALALIERLARRARQTGTAPRALGAAGA